MSKLLEDSTLSFTQKANRIHNLMNAGYIDWSMYVYLLGLLEKQAANTQHKYQDNHLKKS